MFNTAKFNQIQFGKSVGLEVWKYGDLLTAEDLSDFETRINNIETQVKSYTFGVDYPNSSLWNFAYKVKSQVSSIIGETIDKWHYSPQRNLKELSAYNPIVPTIFQYLDTKPVLEFESVISFSFSLNPADMIYYAPAGKYYLCYANTDSTYRLWTYDPNTGQITPISGQGPFTRLFIDPYTGDLVGVNKYGSTAIYNIQSGWQYYNVSGRNTFETSFENILFDGKRYIYMLPKTGNTFTSSGTNYYVPWWIVFDLQTRTINWVEGDAIMFQYGQYSGTMVPMGFLGFDGNIYFANRYYYPDLKIFKCNGFNYESYRVANYGTYPEWIIQFPSGHISVNYPPPNCAYVFRIKGDSLEVVRNTTLDAYGGAFFRQLCGVLFSIGNFDYPIIYYRDLMFDELIKSRSFGLTSSNDQCRIFGQVDKERIYVLYRYSGIVYYKVFKVIRKGW